jgi:Fic family protein
MGSFARTSVLGRHPVIKLTTFCCTDIIRMIFGSQRDIGMIYALASLPPDYVKAVEAVDVLRQRLRYATSDSRRRWTGLLRRNTFARALQGSNSIEGYHVTKDDAEAAVDEEEPFDADVEAWKAVNGYREAMSYVLQLADDPHYVHNEGTINGLHYMMVGFDRKANPGRWRPGAIWVTREPSGETVYEGPDVAAVPSLMRELIASLNASSDLPCIVRAALAHLNLVMIHPYKDGNGRMGRALQTMVLAREGILDPVFSSIEEYLGGHTPDYYEVLGEVGKGAWHPENDALPWIRFCVTAHYRQATTLLRRTMYLSMLWELLEKELARSKLQDRMAVALANAAVGMRVRNSTYRKLLDVSDEVAGKDLRALVDHGWIEPRGEKRGRYYVRSPKLEKLNEEVSAKYPKQAPLDPFDIPSTQSQGSLPF